MPEWLAWLSGAAAAVAGVAAAVRALGLPKLAQGTRRFLDDWFGEPARPGHDGTPSFPERMAEVERRAASVEHFVRGDTSARLQLIALDVKTSQDQASKNHDALMEVNERVTEHRRRNDEQIELLRSAVAAQSANLDEVRRSVDEVRRSTLRNRQEPDP